MHEIVVLGYPSVTQLESKFPLSAIHYWPRHLLSPTLSLLLHWWHVKLNKSGGTGVGYLKLHLYHRNQLSLPLGSQDHLVFNCICFVQRLANLAEGGIFLPRASSLCALPKVTTSLRLNVARLHHLWIDFVVALTSLKDEIQKKEDIKPKSKDHTTTARLSKVHHFIH